MSDKFTDKEIEILKRIADNPIFKNFVPFPVMQNKVPVSLQDIAQRVCDYYEIDKIDFFSNRRSTIYVQARRDYCHLADRHTRHSKYLIGLGLGKDHATVLHHLKKKPINADRIEIEQV
tara:strand:+ start:2821 stop:3177 length:357 start_codon:yes stop_codon:yes gene_type:complete